MKRITLILTVLLLTFSFCLKAQEAKKTGDTTRIRIGTKKILIIEGDKETTIYDENKIDSALNADIEEPDSAEECHKHKKCESGKFKGHWSGLEFGLNNYLTGEGDMLNDHDNLALNQGRSWGFYLNLLQYSMPFIKNHFGFVTGLGLEWNNYGFNNDISLVADTDIVVTEASNIDLSKNKLRTTYLIAPFMLEYQTAACDSKKKFFIGAGLLCCIRLCSSTKQEWGGGHTEHEYIVYDDYNLNTFRYGLTGRIGYGNIGLFANYNITPLFRGNTNYELYPLTVGIRIIGF